jgi:feruloyl-CoA synthase
MTRRGGATHLYPSSDVPDRWSSLSQLFEVHARQHPNPLLSLSGLRVPDGGFGDWRKISHGDALLAARSIAQAVIDRDLAPGSQILIVSGPPIESAVLMMGTLAAQVAIAPVSTNYPLVSTDFARLRYAFEICQGGPSPFRLYAILRFT